MKALLGKYWGLYILGITVQCIVILAVMVRFLAPTNNLAKWLLDSIYDNTATPVGPNVFSFIIDWAEALSVVAVYIIFIPIFIAIMKARRQQALARVNIWAMDAIRKLTSPSNEESVTKKLDDWQQRLHSIIEGSDSVLADTRAIGDRLMPKVEKAVENLLKLENGLNNHTEPDELKSLLQTAVIAVKEISTSTYQSLYRSH